MTIFESVFYAPEFLHQPFFYDENAKDDKDQQETLNLAYFVKYADTKASLMNFDFKVCGSMINCVIDTGASTVFINKQTIEKLIQQQVPLNVENLIEPLIVTLGNGESTECYQRVYIPLQIEESIYGTCAFILDKLPFEMIIGTSFLDAYDVLIRTSTKTIIIDSDAGENVHNKLNSEAFLYLTEELHLPAYCEATVITKCNQKSKSKVFVKSSVPLSERALVYAAKGVLDNTLGEIPIILANLGCKPCSLPKGTIVAKLDSIENQEWEETPLN